MIELVPTELLKDGWEQQHTAYPGDWWVQRYWNSTEGSHRDAIITALEQIDDWHSLLEVGCNTGPNLRRVHTRWPGVDLLGMDIHRGALKFGQDAARAEGWTWTGYCGDLRELHLLGPLVADVVLTCYSLTYLDPRDIDAVLAACLAAARRAVIIAEPMVLGDAEERYAPPMPGIVPEYHYCYQRRLAGLGAPHSTVHAVDPPESRLAHVLIARPPSRAGSSAGGGDQESAGVPRTASGTR